MSLKQRKEALVRWEKALLACTDDQECREIEYTIKGLKCLIRKMQR